MSIYVPKNINLLILEHIWKVLSQNLPETLKTMLAQLTIATNHSILFFILFLKWTKN
jgi:hypothetical protein